MRILIAVLLLAGCKENRAELDRAEQSDCRRAVKMLDEQEPLKLAYRVQPPREPEPPALSPGAKLFTDLMAGVMPGEFCGEAMYFRQCFTIGEAECRSRVTTALAGCIREHAAEMPDQPDAESGRRAGQVLGACAGERYEIALAAEGRRSTRAECDEIDRWR